ncbi:3-sulfopropionylcysteine synthase XcbD [Amycolatopsis alkalitolerans]|uniref:Adenylosuccinate lyase family protein n=1 Tax=Amycolatopsis alkalitolerans TaxID=2547244 RepID=A0A5C4M739_9PSEU|nr:adenylosuccinate lyase family protein [Amycolatopsis alkalitolerans]TNC28260.1 adenylosuccinate lyase family protein [Amycolatopsis alkalitolerans]
MSAHPADSRIYGHLWATPEARALFDDEGRTQSWLDILAALTRAQAALGVVPASAADTIGRYADVSLVDLDQVAFETRETGHSTLGLIRVLRRVLPESAREWVYYGATVQDITDTWTAIVMRAVGDMLVRDLSNVRDHALDLAQRYRTSPMCGRTHGQPGLPVTFGFKAAVWAAELDRTLCRIAEGRRRWEVVQLGGALGTMEFWGERALPLLDRFAAELGLGAPEIPWLTARDRVAEFVWVLAAGSATIAKIGNEVYQLQRPELGEVREASVRGTVGSITMPHKRNPELSEHLVTLSKVVRAQAGLAIEGMVCEHERDARSWKAEWALLPEACLAAAAAASLGDRMLAGLRVDESRMRRNLEAQRGYPMSEPVMRALASRLGKHTAHEIVYEAAMAGLERGDDFRTALRADPRLDVLGDAELDRLLDVDGALGAAPALVDRVLERTKR